MTTTSLGDLEALESLLKLSGSLSVEYVPGSDYKAEEMSFKWSLVKFDSTGIEIDIVFDNPDSVSSYAQDKIKIVFENNSFFIQPSSDDKKALPNGYPIVFDVPP